MPFFPLYIFILKYFFLYKQHCTTYTIDVVSTLSYYDGFNHLPQTQSGPWTWGRFKKTYELLDPRALKISPVNKIHIVQCMGKIFCVEFQRYPSKVPFEIPHHPTDRRRKNNVIITSNGAVTSFRRNNEVIFTSCVRWENILLIHWKIRFLYNIGILRALR